MCMLVGYFMFVKNVKVSVVMRQHNIWCVYVHVHTKCIAVALTFTFLTNFKISNFNKEHISSLKMI